MKTSSATIWYKHQSGSFFIEIYLQVACVLTLILVWIELNVVVVSLHLRLGVQYKMDQKHWWKTAILRFWAALWGHRGNVCCSSSVRWKAGSGLAIIDKWTFFARCYGWGATSKYQLRIGIFAPMGSVWPKILGRWVVLITSHSSCQKTRMNDLSCGIRMWALVSFVLSQSTRFCTIHTCMVTLAHPHTWSSSHGYTVRCITCSRTVKTAPFLKVCNSRIWWLRKVIIYQTVQYIIWSKIDMLLLSQLNILCTSVVKPHYGISKMVIHPLFSVHALWPIYTFSNLLDFIEMEWSILCIKVFTTLSGVRTVSWILSQFHISCTSAVKQYCDKMTVHSPFMCHLFFWLSADYQCVCNSKYPSYSWSRAKHFHWLNPSYIIIYWSYAL